MLCRKQVAELVPHLQAIRQSGGDVVMIGTGSPGAAEAFRNDTGLGHVRIFVDEKRRAFDLAGFHRGLGTLLGPRAVGNYLRALLQGYRPARTQGDAFQQGGVLVVAPDGSIHFRYASRASGAQPDVRDILAAVREASRSGAPAPSPPGLCDNRTEGLLP